MTGPAADRQDMSPDPPDVAFGGSGDPPEVEDAAGGERAGSPEGVGGWAGLCPEERTERWIADALARAPAPSVTTVAVIVTVLSPAAPTGGDAPDGVV